MRLVTKHPLTLLLMFAVVSVSYYSRETSGRLGPGWLAELGIAPRHVRSGEVQRIATSLFLTHDIQHLAMACAMILAIVGWTEQTIGFWKTLWTFLMAHAGSIALFSIGIGLLHWLRFGQTVTILYSLHDVGPSAGYYGCLGRSILTIPEKYRSWSIATLICVLVARILGSLWRMPESQIALSADIVHLLACTLGAAMGAIAMKMDRTSSTNSRWAPLQ